MLIIDFIGDDKHNQLCYEEFGNIDYSGCKGYYHNSWDWLMPVAKNISDNEKSNNGEGEALAMCVDLAVIQYEIEVAWLAVIEYITWYNSQKEATS